MGLLKFINKEIKCIIQSVWTIITWQHNSPDMIVKGFKRCYIANGMMGLMMICCGMAVKRTGMSRVSVRKIKALTVKMETVSLIDKG